MPPLRHAAPQGAINFDINRSSFPSTRYLPLAPIHNSQDIFFSLLFSFPLFFIPSLLHMDAPALTPNAASLSLHQSGFASSSSTTPELTTPATEPERSSTETCIFSIYSMYGEDESGWTIPAPTVSCPSRHLQVEQQGRKPYIRASKLSLEDSGYSESSYDPRFSKHLLQMDTCRESNGTTLLAYADDDRRTSYHSANQKTPPSRPQSRRLSAVSQQPSTTFSPTPFPTGIEPSSRTNSSGSSTDQPFLSPDPSLSRPISRVNSPRVSAVLPPPSLRESVPPSSPHLSKVVVIPHEGEDEDSFHVRRTYAELEVVGVRGDGYAEGVERTRARVGSNRESGIRALEALGDIAEKKRDLTPREIEILASLDRSVRIHLTHAYGVSEWFYSYGFLSSPSHDRLLLLSSAPLSKRLSRASAITNSSPTAPPLKEQVLPPSSEKEIQRVLKWARMLEPTARDPGGNILLWGVKASKRRKLRERAYKGIPDCWRSAAWELMINEMSGAGRVELDRLSQEYEDHLQQPSTYDIQIDLDVPRTISGHVMFRTRYGQGYAAVCLPIRRLPDPTLGSDRYSTCFIRSLCGAVIVGIARAWGLSLRRCCVTWTRKGSTLPLYTSTTRTRCILFSSPASQGCWKPFISRNVSSNR